MEVSPLIALSVLRSLAVVSEGKFSSSMEAIVIEQPVARLSTSKLTRKHFVDRLLEK
jgi:hypothetical protein